MPARYPERYAGYTPQRLCDEMHQFYRDRNIKELQRLCFRSEHFPEQAMSVQHSTEATWQSSRLRLYRIIEERRG